MQRVSDAGDDDLGFIGVVGVDIDNLFDELRDFGFSPGSTEWFTARICSLVAIFGLRNYYATSILMAFVTFLGIWKFFLMIANRYPKVHKGLALSILFVPSVFFWGSGLLKDAIVLGALGYLMYFVDIFARKGFVWKIWSGLIILFCSYIIYNIKSYVIISLLPSIFIWVVLEFRGRIQSPVLRVLVLPLLLVVSLLGAVGAFQFLSQYSDKYSVDNVLETAEGMQKWHYAEGEESADEIGRGSGYTLGEYDSTYGGLLSQFLPAVNVTLFRPYLWEVKNVAMLAAAIESTIILGFSIFVFLGLGFFKVLKLLREDSFLLMAVFFAVFFAFAVGFSSYNFGALVRYKIPCIPFYLASLFILRQKVADLKAVKQMRLETRKRRSVKPSNRGLSVHSLSE